MISSEHSFKVSEARLPCAFSSSHCFFRSVDILNMTKIDCFWVVQMMKRAQHNSDLCEGCVIGENTLLQAFQAGWSWEKTEPDKSAPEVTATLATQKSIQNRHKRGRKNAGVVHVTGSRQSLAQKRPVVQAFLKSLLFH